MPNQQMPNNFEMFSEEYLNSKGFFKPEGLHKFRNEIAGHISYLNREKDARQFSQPVISVIQTNVYDKEILNYNKKLTRKLYSTMSKDINNKLKTLKSNPILKAKIPDGYNTLKKICDSYEYPKAKNACNKEQKCNQFVHLCSGWCFQFKHITHFQQFFDFLIYIVITYTKYWVQRHTFHFLFFRLFLAY